MDCCDPAAARSWRLFRKRFIHIQENCFDFSPRLYDSFFRNRRAWMCHLSVPRQPPTNIWPPKDVSPLAGSYVKQSVLKFCCSFFRNGKGGGKTHPPKRGPCNRASYVKKSSFSSSFHFSRTGCSWMCHLSVPWQPPGNPPKDLQVVFDGLLHVFAKCGKKDRKIRPPKSVQSLIASYVKKAVLGRYASFFRNRRAWMILDVPP